LQAAYLGLLAHEIRIYAPPKDKSTASPVTLSEMIETSVTFWACC
jgi:hypothetical protein